ncbi:MAG TPA: hypothetical protein VGP25_19820 [Gemmatimonadaceae bacterium]|jgi:hypothetical protein|nr:hypothetical protein [Gemmatimonadaceae bacterium]
MISPLLTRSAAGPLLLACAALSSCAVFRREPEQRSITVELPVSRAEAVRRTTTAFREQGYPLRPTLTSGLQPESQPFRQGDEAEAVFRASISGTTRASHVVLSGTYRRLRLRGVVRDDEQELRKSDDPLERRLWTRLEQLRLAIRQPQ